MKRRDFIQALLGGGAAALMPSTALASLLKENLPEELPDAIIKVGQWHHIGIVRQAGILKTYVDGVNVNTETPLIDINSNPQDDTTTFKVGHLEMTAKNVASGPLRSDEDFTIDVQVKFDEDETCPEQLVDKLIYYKDVALPQKLSKTVDNNC